MRLIWNVFGGLLRSDRRKGNAKRREDVIRVKLALLAGVCAGAIIAARLNDWPANVQVQVLGGDTLGVVFASDSDEFSNVQLIGPAQFVFEGTAMV